MKPIILQRFKLRCALLLLFPFATSATAEDFTFTVPYSFKAVQDGSNATIGCNVYTANNDLLGSQTQIFRHPDMHYLPRRHTGNTVLTFKFNASTGKDASMARRYTCSLVGYDNSKSSYTDVVRSVREVYGEVRPSPPIGIPVPPHSPIR